MDTQFKKGVLEICALSLLVKKDYYGYELVRKISVVLKVSEGTLYPLLRRLEKEEYLQTYFEESKEGPKRKYYMITKKGRDKEKELTLEWNSFSKKVNKLIK